MRKPCCDHKQDKNKGAWSKQEDQKLIDYIQAHGEGCWRSLPQAAGLLRCGKSCRLRWINYLRPNLKRGNFGEDEEDLIIKLHALLGNRWSLIAGRLPGRTDNEVKNHWNSHLRRKLIRMGIDPNNHRLAHSTLPRDQDQRVSSESDNNQPCDHHHDHVPVKSHANYKDRVSEVACSGLEEDISGLPDLNLDLTMAFNPSTSLTRVEDRTQQNVESRVIRSELENSSSPTLLLFT